MTSEPVNTAAGLDPEDSQARRDALTVGQSFIVQAPAGSGKTELLSQRVLALLAVADAPEEILAVTFTRKAAGEMRGRIVAALERARDETPPEESHRQVTWTLARNALQRATEQGWDLLDNPARLRIFTIDALCASLARRMPVLSRLGGTVGVCEDPSLHYRAAVRAVLASLDGDEPVAPNLESLMSHLDNDQRRVEELLITMLEMRDHWLRHVADRDNPDIQRPNLQAALEASVSSALYDLRESISAGMAKEICDLASYAAGQLKAAGRKSPVLACLEMATLPDADCGELAAWQGLRELLLTAEGSLRKRITITQGFPAPTAAKDESQQARFTEYKERFSALTEWLDAVPGLVERLAAVAYLPPTRFKQIQWTVFQSLIAVLPRAVAELKLSFRSAGEVDFTEMAHAALLALGRADEPTDLALQLDHSIRHILVDEFQDTSFSQFELIKGLTAGWQPDDGHTLFVVGDPMQSIYRFREAEVGLFLRARRKGIGAIDLVPLLLRHNFRSDPGLVDWFNTAFSRVFPALEDLASDAVPYSPALAVGVSDGTDAVTIHASFGDDREREAATVAGLIRDTRLGDPNGSIAVLVRSRSHLVRILPLLRDAGMRYTAVDLDPLSAQPEIRDAAALTRALLHFGDRVAWLSILRAPWCGMTLTDLHALTVDDRSRTIWELMLDESRRARLSDDGQRRLARVKAVLALTLARRARLNLRRWVEGAWRALGGAVCAPLPAQKANLDVFFSMLENLDDGGDLDDLDELDAAVGRLYAQPDTGADPNLQIMTIHKAKGLEFDTVIVPGLGHGVRGSRDRLLMWLEKADLHGEPQLLLAPIRPTGGEDLIHAYLRYLDQQRDRNEWARLLYVAATRARRQLHLLGHVSAGSGKRGGQPASRSLLDCLWPAVESQFDVASQADAATAGVELMEEAVRTTGLRRLPSDWMTPELTEISPWRETPNPAEDIDTEFRWASEAARHIGTAVHRTLQQVAEEGPDAWLSHWLQELQPYLSRMLEMLGVPRDELASASERAAQAVRNTLADERGRWILESHPDAGTEFPLSGWIDGHLVNLVLDRTFKDEQGRRWIIDYKTGSHEGGTVDGFLDNEMDRYRGKMELYATLMRRMDPTPIRLALYFPMMQGWREWDAMN